MITVKMHEFNGFATMLYHIHVHFKINDIDSSVLAKELGKKDAQYLSTMIEQDIPVLKYCSITVTVNAPLYWWGDLQARCADYEVSFTPHKIHEINNDEFSMERMTNEEQDMIKDIGIQLNAEYETWLNNKCKDSFQTWYGLLPQCYKRSGVLTISLEELRKLFAGGVTATFTEWSDFFESLDEQGMPLFEYVTGWY